MEVSVVLLCINQPLNQPSLTCGQSNIIQSQCTVEIHQLCNCGVCLLTINSRVALYAVIYSQVSMSLH